MNMDRFLTRKRVKPIAEWVFCIVYLPYVLREQRRSVEEALHGLGDEVTEAMEKQNRAIEKAFKARDRYMRTLG